MYKLLVIFFCGLVFPLFSNAQADSTVESKIDNITSKEQIEQLLRSIDPSFSTFHVNDPLNFSNDNCNRLKDSLHCLPWFKADFDNNGYNDLLVVGGWDDHAVFCILDSGDNKFVVDRLTRKIFQGCTFPVLKKNGNDNLVLYYSFSETKADSIKVDTLIYKFGDFVNYHSLPAKYAIEKIEFTTDACLGQCPQFKLIIDSNRNAHYDAINYNKQYGRFEGVIDENNFLQLMQLLWYLDFPDLDNDYAVNWKNDQSCTLIITYDDGKVKTIHDDGLHGTFGLERVYRILFGFRDNQQWEKNLPAEKK